ncbi:hypothetical protein ACOMHN_016222 [Nucella lapillus]
MMFPGGGTVPPSHPSSSSCDSPTKLHARDLNLRSYEDGEYFRYLAVDTKSGYLFVGAMNSIHALDLKNIENANRGFKQEFNAQPRSTFQCKLQGKADSPDCQNNVRLLVRNSSVPNTFYMCSTGAYQPIAYRLRLENRRFRILREDSENDGVGICPYDPADNTTAILVENGNPGGLPALYAGGVTDFIKADPIIMRPDLYNLNQTLKVRYVRTLRDRSKWLNEPQFVGSFELGNHVYFFFREVALEYTNCGKKIYSRVVRICKNDQGGRYILRNVWTSFVKARLNCSIPGEYPYYFDEIQDVSLIGETFYGLFTTNINGLTASAICAFTLEDLNKAFWGPFKGQENKKSNWLPIPEVEVPNPRPGNCTVADTQQLSTAAVNFISRSELLMDKAVATQYGRPIFYQSNCLLQKLSVHHSGDVSRRGGLVFFAASNTGFVYKIFAWPSRSRSEGPRSYVSTTYMPFEDTRPIWSMLLRGETLYLGTDLSVVQINVETCHVYPKVDLCIYDPYCGWDANTNLCVKAAGNNRVITFADINLYTHDLERAVQLKVGDLYNYEKIFKITGSSVTLRVEYKLHVTGTVTWRRNNSAMSDDRHILAQDNSLIITDLRKSDEGVYEAMDYKKRTVAKYLLSIETTKEQIEQRWMRKFDQWCDEFERYQNDIRQWEHKCASAMCTHSHMIESQEQKCSSCCEESSQISRMVPGIDDK